MELQQLSTNSSACIYKENKVNLDVNDKEVFDKVAMATIANLGLDKERKMNSECADEESNNGPLDFSLHRVQDIVFSDRSNSCSSRSDRAPRVKLTLRETSEQRQRRLEKGRERMRNLRSNETAEERSIRLYKARKCQERRRQRERALESAMERERRLNRARERTRLRREQETTDQREKRLRTTRERLRYKRLSESQDDRQKRLFVQRERKKEKYHRMTPEEKELLRFGERHSKQYKTETATKTDKRQTRGICIKYDTFEDDLDEALLKFQNEAQHIANEPEVCLSVGSLDNFSSEKSNTGTKDKSANGPTVYEANATSVPPAPQDLQEQLSQHISNVAMSINDSNKPTYDGTNINYKMNCYPAAAPPPPPPPPSTQANENYASFHCNNNQSEYMKGNTNSSCVSSSSSAFNVFHGGGRPQDNRYQYCSQGYPPQSVNNSSTVPNSIGSNNFAQQSHPIYTQPSQPMPQRSNYSEHEAPLNLQHHSQMIPR